MCLNKSQCLCGLAIGVGAARRLHHRAAAATPRFGGAAWRGIHGARRRLLIGTVAGRRASLCLRFRRDDRLTAFAPAPRYRIARHPADCRPEIAVEPRSALIRRVSRQWGRARQASDAPAAWPRERRGVRRARGIEGVGATPVHSSAGKQAGPASGRGNRQHAIFEREPQYPADAVGAYSLPLGRDVEHV
jgi:hypothetical protein